MRRSDKMKFLQLDTFYKNYIKLFYEAEPKLSKTPYRYQMHKLLQDGFSSVHQISPYLTELNYETDLIVANCKYAQIQWAKEHNLKFSETNWVTEITKKQIENFKPDILYTTDPVLFDTAFMNKLSWKPVLIIGWFATILQGNIDWTAYDIILSNSIPCQEKAYRFGAKATNYFSPGFPDFLTDKISQTLPKYDIVISGSITTAHIKRKKYIESVINRNIESGHQYSIGCYTNGDILDLIRNQGACWGINMYKKLRMGKIILNISGDIGNYSNKTINMRCIEATGVGSFLLTDHFQNIHNYFKPNYEIETFSNEDELFEKIDYYLKNSKEREAIAKQGQKKCLHEYSMTKKAAEFKKIIQKHLGKKNAD